MFEVKEIEFENTLPLRHKVLRPQQSVQDCIYDTDFNSATFHVGAYYHDELVCVASFNKEEFHELNSEKQYRLRAMATLAAYRKLGAGRLVVQYAEQKIKKNGGTVLWCKGRIGVQDYYKKLGFVAFGNEFDYPPIGMHIIMCKEI